MSLSKTKKCHFYPFRHNFKPHDWDIISTNVRRLFTGRSFSPDTELKTYVRFLKNSTGLRYGDDSVELFGKIIKIVDFNGANLKIRGGGICPPKSQRLPVFDSEFNVNYDFAIKHDPIQSDN